MKSIFDEIAADTTTPQAPRATVFDGLGPAPSPAAHGTMAATNAPAAPVQAMGKRTVFDGLAEPSAAASRPSVFDDIADPPTPATEASRPSVFDDLDTPAAPVTATTASTTPAPDYEAMRRDLARQWGMREEATYPQLVERWMSTIPTAPEGATPEQQNAVAIAQREWFKQNPMPELFRTMPDVHLRKGLTKLLARKMRMSPSYTIGQTIGRAYERGVEAPMSRMGAGILDFGAKLGEVAQHAPGIAGPAYNPEPFTVDEPTQEAQTLRQRAQRIEQRAADDPGTARERALATAMGATANVAPAIVGGMVGGPAVGGGIAALQAGGYTQDRVYSRLIEQGFPQDEAMELAAMAAAGAAYTAAAAGSLPGSSPVARSIGGRAAEAAAEGGAYGALQAGAEELLTSTATGGKPDWSRVPTEGAIGAALGGAIGGGSRLLQRGQRTGQAAPEQPRPIQQPVAEVSPQRQPASAEQVSQVDAGGTYATLESDKTGQPAVLPRKDAGEPQPIEQSRPRPVYSYNELRRMSKAKLRQQAEEWGVPYDTRSTTIPRILDAQARWRLEQMSDKQLWDEVRRLGLRAGRREQNIQTLLAADGQALQPAMSTMAGETRTEPARPAPIEPLAESEVIPGDKTPQRAQEAQQQPTPEIPPRTPVVEGQSQGLAQPPAEANPEAFRPLLDSSHFRWIVKKAKRQTHPDGTVEWFFDGTLPPAMRRKLGDMLRKTPATYRDGDSEGIYNFRVGDTSYAVHFDARKSNQNHVRVSIVDESVPAQRQAQGQAQPATAAPAEVPAPMPAEATPRPIESAPAPAEAPQAAPKPAAKPRAPRGFSKADLERKLIQHAEEMGEGYTAEQDTAIEEAGVGGNAFTFHRKLPGQVRQFIESNPAARKLFRVSENVAEAGGEDAMATLGERYWTIAQNRAGAKLGRALEVAKNSPDPEVQFLAALYENLPPAKERRPQTLMQPDDLQVGQTFEIHGHRFEVIKDADGYRVLRDGQDYPVVPLEALSAVPVDKGTLKEAPRFFDPEAEGIQSRAQTGLFGQAEYTKGTGEQVAPLFHEPVAVARPAESAQDARIRRQYQQGEAATGALFGEKAAPAGDSQAQGLIDRLIARGDESFERLQRKWAGRATTGLDPTDIPDLVNIGVGLLARGVRTVQEFSNRMVNIAGESIRPYVLRIWKDSRAEWRQWQAQLKENRLAARAVGEATIPQAEEAKTTIRRITGQVDARRAIGELALLRATLTKAQAASHEGYQSAVRELTGLKQNLARIIRENIPAEQQGKFLSDVAKITTMGQMRYAVAKATRILADHEMTQALHDLEKLTGTLKLDVYDSRRPELTEAGEAEAIAQRMVRQLKQKGEIPLRHVDLTTLAEPHRERVKGLIEQAKALKLRLRKIRNKGTVEEKYRLLEEFRRIERAIRQEIADDLATKELRIGERLRRRDDLVAEVVAKVDPDHAARPVSSAGPKDAGPLKRFFGRGHFSAETITGNMLGEGTDAHRLTIENIRRGQEGYYAEQKSFYERMSKAYEEAGLPPGTKKLNDWMSKREKIVLPDAGEIEMTRNEMAEIAASAGDPQTLGLIQRGIGWTFESNRREDPFKLTIRDILAIERQLTPGERKLIQAFKAYNRDHLTHRAMRAKLEMSGWAPDPHEGYFPRSRNRAQSPDQGLPEGWRGHRQRLLENISSMEERTAETETPLMVKGFTQRIFEYVEDTAKLIHLAEPVRMAAAVWEDPRVTKAIARKYGESMNRRIGQYLADTMLTTQKPPRSMIGKAWSFLARNFSRAWLQANPSPMAKNVLGGTLNLMPEFDLVDYLAGLRAMFNPSTFKRMVDASSVAWNRYHGGLYGVYSPILDRHVETVAEMTFGQALKARQWGQAIDAIPFMKWADSVPLRAAFAASEHFVNRTMPHASPAAKRRAILDKFHEVVYRTQNGNSSTEISGLASHARQNALEQAFFMFTSDANKRYNQLARMKNADGRKRAKVILAILGNAAISAAVHSGLRGGASLVGRAITGAKKDPVEAEKRFAGAIWSAARDLAGLAYFANWLDDIIYNAIGGRDLVLQTPPEQLATNLIDSLTDFVKAASAYATTHADDPEFEAIRGRMLSNIERLFLSGFTAFGVPIEPGYRLARRAVQAATYQPPDPRLAESKAETRRRTELRNRIRLAVPGAHQLLRERANLDQLGGLGNRKLSDAERARLARLNAFARDFDAAMDRIHEATDRGDTQAIEREKRFLAERAARIREDRGNLQQAVFDRELTALRAKARAYEQARELLKQPAKRQEAVAAVRTNRLTAEERARLMRLEGINRAIHSIERRLEAGQISEDAAHRQIQRLLETAKPRQAA